MKRWVVFTLLFSLVVPAVILAETVDDTVAGISFATSPQSIEPGTLSEIITIQTVDAGGNPSNIGETSDLTFTSSSPTGEFLNDRGELVSTTMSRNSARRNFYYRDSTAGNYTLTVTLTGRTSLRSWTATQNIGVGEAVADGFGDNPETAATVTSGTASSVTVVKDKKSGVSSPLKVEIIKLPPAVAGAPVTFKAKVSGVNKDDKNVVLLHWSFGDGGEALGSTVYHTYQFVGRYIVVLNARTAEEEMTMRTVVEVSEPTLEIAAIGYVPVPYVQLVNKSTKEIDLGAWQLTDQTRVWNLPVNTIISPNAKLNLPVETTNLSLTAGVGVSLLSPSGRVVAQHGVVVATAPAPEQQAKIARIKSDLEHLVAQVDVVARRQWVSKQASKVLVETPPPVPVPEPPPTVLELPKKTSVLEQGWNKVKNAILR